MTLKQSYKKFKKNLIDAGLAAALWRAIKYAVYLIKNRRMRLGLSSRSVSVDKIRIMYTDAGVKIFFDEIEITQGAGLNCAIKSHYSWTDSSHASLRLIEKGVNCLRLEVIFRNICVRQIWKIVILGKNQISWSISQKDESPSDITQMRALALINQNYKTWICDCQHSEFPRLDTNWRSLNQDSAEAVLVGSRFSSGNNVFVPIILEVAGPLQPIIQNPPRLNASHIIGYEIEPQCPKFECVISIFDDESKLDEKIEKLRKRQFEMALESKHHCGKLNIMLANLPWERDGAHGVRAGSRWPHIKDSTEGDYSPFPFFLAYADALLKKNGIKSSVVDALAEKMNVKNFINKITAANCDYLVAETSVASFYSDLLLLDKISQSGIKIILCGPNYEIYNTQFLEKHGFIDFVLYGEYEYALLDLIGALQKNRDISSLEGIIFRQGSGVIKNPPRPLLDVNSLPWPERDSLPMANYLDTPGGIPAPSAQMIASRGCLYGCSFCLWPQVMYGGSNYRARDINDVADEMEFLIKNKGFKSIYFDDDTFNINRERMINFSNLLKQRGLEKTPWAIMARADLMDEELLAIMKSAGLYAVKYGVESCAPSLLEKSCKKLDLTKTEKIIKSTKDMGIKTHLTFVFGLDGETQESMQKTIDFAIRLDPDTVQFSILTPFPGTKLYEDLCGQGRILTKDTDRFDGHFSCVFKPDNVNPRAIILAKDNAYKQWDDHVKKRATLGLKISRFASHIKDKGLSSALTKSFNNIKNNNRVFINAKNFARHMRTGRLIYDFLLAAGIYTGRRAIAGPYHVQIDLTSNCNNDCLACWCNSPLLEEKAHAPKNMSLPYSLVKNLLDELSGMGTKELYFSGGGEPFMYPKIMKILSYAKKRGFICYINTNFTIPDKITIRELIDLGIDYLTVSTWSATPGTYASTHPNKDESDFKRIIENLKYLNNSKRGKPHIKLYNVIFSHNCHEFRDMVKLAKDTKSESVEFTVVDTIPGRTDKLFLTESQVKELRNAAQEIADSLDAKNKIDGVQVIGLDSFLRRISSDKDMLSATYDRNIIDKIPCYIGWYFSRIMPNGDVNACLKSHRIPTGNLHESSFRKIWNSQLQACFRKNTLVYQKSDAFFRLIGNDPDTMQSGCYKSCDDIGRNAYIHNLLRSLPIFGKFILKNIREK